MAVILVPTSPGELIDKITILQIKRERISDPAKLANVRRELDLLIHAREQSVPESKQIGKLSEQLKAANEALWDIEDHLRMCETNSDFGPRFVELARLVYRHNDVRCGLKRRINELLGSELVEEKGYRIG